MEDFLDKLRQQQAAKPAEAEMPAEEQVVPSPPPPPETARSYRADQFTLNLADGWEDQTVFTLTGPVSDGIQHNIIINREAQSDIAEVAVYADMHIRAMESELKGWRLLKRGEITLDNGLPAYQAIYRWYPSDEVRIYQQQIYVLAPPAAYKLTASFSKKTRKTLGPLVERMMRSFNPLPV